MAKSSLIVDDEYCKSMGQYFVKEGADLENYLMMYIDILERIRLNAIVKGDVADSLKAYITYAKKIKGQISILSKEASNVANKYVQKIDEADQFLF